MRLERTEKARKELQRGVRTLGQRERTLLLLADGEKTAQEISKMFLNQGEAMIRQLMQDGYLSEVAPRLVSERIARRLHPED